MIRPEDEGRAAAEWVLDPDVVAERIGGKLVLVHLRSNKIYELNETATRIVERMRRGAGRAELLATLSREYEIERERLEASFERLLGELRALGILR